MVLKPLIPIISFVVEILFPLENHDQPFQQYRIPLLRVDLTLGRAHIGQIAGSTSPLMELLLSLWVGAIFLWVLSLLSQERAKHHKNRCKNFVIRSLHVIKILLLDLDSCSLTGRSITIDRLLVRAQSHSVTQHSNDSEWCLLAVTVTESSISYNVIL